jgi:hypothetical protein
MEIAFKIGREVERDGAKLYRGRIYNWMRDCPQDVQRRSFPPVVGPGRGQPLKR